MKRLLQQPQQPLFYQTTSKVLWPDRYSMGVTFIDQISKGSLWPKSITDHKKNSFLIPLWYKDTITHSKYNCPVFLNRYSALLHKATEKTHFRLNTFISFQMRHLGVYYLVPCCPNWLSIWSLLIEVIAMRGEGCRPHYDGSQKTLPFSLLLQNVWWPPHLKKPM